MVTDLVQLRWQHIRLFERMLETQRENTVLRKNLSTINDSSDSKKQALKDNLRKVYGILKTTTKLLRNDLKEIKSNLKKDLIEFVENTRTSLLTMKVKYVDVEISREAALRNLRTKSEEHERRAERLQRQLDSSSHNSSVEAIKLEGKISKLKDELETMTRDRDRLVREVDTGKNQLALVQGKLESSQKACTEAQDDARGLRSKLRLAGENDQRLQAMVRRLEDEHRAALHNSELANSVLRDENEQLRDALTDMETQLNKLLSLHGDKTNFAKFVALKQENIALHSRITALTRPRDKDKRDRDKDKEKAVRKLSNAGRQSLLDATSASAQNKLPGSTTLQHHNGRRNSSMQAPTDFLESKSDPSFPDDRAGRRVSLDSGRSALDRASASMSQTAPPQQQRYQERGSHMEKTREKEYLIARVAEQTNRGAASDPSSFREGGGPFELDYDDSIDKETDEAEAVRFGGSKALAEDRANERYSIQPGVPLMNRTTREALKKRTEL